MQATTSRRPLRWVLVAVIATLTLSALPTGSATAAPPPPPSQGIPYDHLPPATGQEYATFGKWDHTGLTYFFVNGTSDIANTAEQDAIEQAMALWAAASPLTFTEVSSAAEADIEIRFATGNHGDGFAFDGANGVLAHAFYPIDQALDGDVHFDDAETWTTAERVGTSAQPMDLVTVAAHELGHALGLQHSVRPAALMYAFYGGSHRFLHEDDADAIEALYAGGPPANDAFDHAPMLRGGMVMDTTTGGTKQPGEPNHAGNVGGASVWYRFTEVWPHLVTISTVADRTNFDTVLAVYRGDSVDDLTPVIANDDVSANDPRSQVSFITKTDEQIWIAVDGFCDGCTEPGPRVPTGTYQIWLTSTDQGAPLAPSGVNLARGPSTGSLRVSWHAALAPPRTPVERYRVVCTAPGGVRGKASAGATATQVVVSGLTRGLKYSCKVRAYTAQGASAFATAPTLKKPR